MSHSIKCGNCKGRHDNVQEVRNCYAGLVSAPRAVDATTGSSDLENPATLMQEDAERQAVPGPRWWLERKNEERSGQAFLFPPSDTQVGSKRTGGPVTEDGMYKLGDSIYKVQRAVHGSGHLYAKRLTQQTDGTNVVWKFVYAKGAIKLLTSEDKMTLEQAQEFGRLYGVCCSCGATLTNEESIELGIGPICRGRWFG